MSRSLSADQETGSYKARSLTPVTLQLHQTDGGFSSVFSFFLTCIYLIAGGLSGEKSRDSVTRSDVTVLRRPCDTMRIRRRAYRNTIMLIRSSVLYGTMYRVASICFCISQRCTSHRTMYMTYYTTYTWMRHDSVKAEYDTCFFFWRCDPTRIMASSFLRFSRSHTTAHHSR